MAPKNPLHSEVMYPPFTGFPEEGFAFLKRLKKNNNRPWFLKHKEEYEETVRFPMQCLIASLGARLADDAPEFMFDPKKSIFRIYRDVRFSKDKAPYKTNIAASFEMSAAKKSPTETPGFYVGIEPTEVFIGGGLYMPTGDQLKGIRNAIASKPDELLEIVKSPRFKKRFGSVMGATLQRAPLGYPPDHPMIEYLKQKQWFVGTEPEPKAVHSEKFVAQVADTFVDALPFIRWLSRVSS
jgi:uncharacterized protein (TIGR02453 family)